MKLTAVFVVLLAAVAVQSQEPKFYRVEHVADDATPATIHFFCSQGYDTEDCRHDVAALRRVLAPYPLQLLGEWSFYLVLAPDWKPLARGHGGPAVSPAFSLLLGHATVIDRSLFSGSADRNIELEKWSGMPVGPAFVDFAVTHELGHAICQDTNERHANDYGKELRDSKVLDCSETPGWKPSGKTQSTAPTTDANQSGDDSIKSRNATFGAPDHGDWIPPEPGIGVSELHRRPEIQGALREIWVRAGGGVYKTESAFIYDKTVGVELVPPTNQFEKMSIEIRPTTQAIFHTHPIGQNRMSENDINTANQNHVDMYVLSRDGLYFYSPGMRAPRLVVFGTDFLRKDLAMGRKPNGETQNVVTASTSGNPR